MANEYKRILSVQDISCVGQCSLTVALPILSASPSSNGLNSASVSSPAAESPSPCEEALAEGGASPAFPLAGKGDREQM